MYTPTSDVDWFRIPISIFTDENNNEYNLSFNYYSHTVNINLLYIYIINEFYTSVSFKLIDSYRPSDSYISLWLCDYDEYSDKNLKPSHVHPIKDDTKEINYSYNKHIDIFHGSSEDYLYVGFYICL